MNELKPEKELPPLEPGHERMTPQQARARGLVPMTEKEYERYRSLPPEGQRAFLAAKKMQSRAEHLREKGEQQAALAAHPLGGLDPDDRRAERNRRKARRRG